MNMPGGCSSVAKYQRDITIEELFLVITNEKSNLLKESK